MDHFGEMGAIRGACFDPCDSHISLKEAFENSKSMETFALLIEINLL